mmetsp:Transcript_9715/g.16661  ORF Transcript_9715/g.16661 Transcript_9715/m.16661 type:complete len:145 (+) Transcript_9715:88-522(+)
MDASGTVDPSLNKNNYIGPGQFSSPLNLDERVGMSDEVEVLYRHLLRTHLLEVYQPSVDRMRKLLSELRLKQNSVKDSLTGAQSNMEWNNNLEDTLAKIESLPLYARKAAAVTKEMNALRARMDRAKLESHALLREVSTKSLLE